MAQALFKLYITVFFGLYTLNAQTQLHLSHPHYIKTGQSGIIEIEIDSVYNLFSYSLNFYYNRQLIEITKVLEGTFLNENRSQSTSFIYRLYEDEGKISIANARLNAQTGGVSTDITKTLFTIEVVAAKEGVCPLAITDLELFDAEQNRIYYQLTADSIIIKDITALNSAHKEIRMISVYPNPAQNYLMVVLEASFTVSGNIHLFNSLGQRLASWAIRNNKTCLDLKKLRLSAGFYFLSVRNEDQFSVKKIYIISKE